MWQECTFVFDANVLLNIYRYTSETREELFDILESLKERTWLPHQAMLEYLENREVVISQQYSIAADIEEALEEASETIEEKYKRGHPFADTTLIKKQIQEAIEKIKTSIVQAQSQYPNLLESDVLLERLTNLFNGRVGSEYPPKRLEEIYKEFEQRFRLQIPPGYKDKNPKKEGFKKYGDGVLWFQIIEYAKSQNKPFILVTDDQKDDWWQIEKGKTLGPRPELITEISSKAKVSFYMYNSSQFMKFAKDFLGLQVKQEAINEVRDVSQQGSYKRNTIIRRGFQALDAVQLWLETTYPQYKIVEEPRDIGVDFLLIGQDETRIGVEVKYREAFFFSKKDFERLLKLANDPNIGQALNQFLIVLVCKDELLANELRIHFPSLLSIPVNSSFLIGYLNSNGSFSVFSTIP